MNINIQTIPHQEQRYNTVGDYWERQTPEGATVVEVRISVLPNPLFERLILIHELVEYFLVSLAGIPIQAIDDFDIAFEAQREPSDLGEPGDQRQAPYYHQHQMATVIERLCAFLLGVDWQDYEDAVNSLV